MGQTLSKQALGDLVCHVKDRAGVRTRFAIVVLLVILPALLALWFIRQYAVDVCVWDDLQEAVLFDKLYRAHLSLSDIFAPHSEHRMVLGRLTFIVFGVVTHLNAVYISYFSWFLTCLVCLVFYLALRRTVGTRLSALAALIPIAWVMFSLRQTQIIEGCSSLQIYVILFFLLSMYLLATGTGLRWRFAVSIACAVLCTYSMANGLLVWPIGFVVLLWFCRSHTGETRRVYLAMAGIWCVAAIAVFLAYFLNSTDMIAPSRTESALHNPRLVLLYFLTIMGSQAYYQGAAYVFALFLLLLCAFVVINVIFRARAQPPAALALALILFGLGSGAIITWSRYFLDEALSARYTTYTNPAIVGVYLGMMSLRTERMKAKPFVAGLLALLLAIGIVVPYYPAIKKDAPASTAFREQAAYILSTYTVQSDQAIGSYLYPFPWNPELAKEGALVLKKYGLSVFSRPGINVDDLVPVAGPAESEIEYVNNRQANQQEPGVLQISPLTETLIVQGWAIDQVAGDTAGAVFISIDGGRDIPARYGADRPDIAARFGNSRYRASGFEAWFATSVVGSGPHVLSVKIVTHDKTGYYVPSQGVAIQIT